MPDTHPLEQAIADLLSRRALLGDAVVDAAVAALRAQLALQQPAAAAPRGARLRQVSVLFVDVVDSTALLQRVGPEDAQDVMGRALERFAALVASAGGEVLRFTGDGLKAVFGTQGVHEDEAERAVRAGLQILQAAAAHGQQLRTTHSGLRQWQFGVRVGIHTGPVLLGEGPEADRTAMGHAVHLAARMEQSAPVGQLRISEATFAQVRGLFQLEPQPALRVKGHDEALKTWLVLGELRSAERAAQRGVEGVHTALVGRAAEIASLEALWQGCCSTPGPALAVVLADAGMGKTRLRHELLQRLGATALQARAHPSSGLQSYGLLRQLLTRWLDVGDDLPADAARQRFVQGLLPWLADEPVGTGTDAQTQAQRLGHLLGLDFSAQPQVQALGGRELRTQALATLARLLRALAREQPLLVVLDDVHWADDASLDALPALLARGPEGTAPLPPVPLMLLVLARPALLERREAPAAPEGVPQTTVRLQALAESDGRALADALLARVQDPPQALQSLLVQRAQGNPFFMEELVRRLIADGVITTDVTNDSADDTAPWQVHAERLQNLRVPDTLVGLLQARLDSFPANELAALQQASIVGPVFWHNALADLDAQAPTALPALLRRDVVVPRPHSTFAHDVEHGFQHPLLHEVTYDTVLKPVRRAGHARMARWLAERMQGREAEFRVLVAEHHERAGDYEEALLAYKQAQSEASRRYAYSESLALLDRALALPLTLPPFHQFHLMVRRQTALEHLGRAAESRAQQDQIAAFAETQDNDAMRAEVASLRMLQADHEGQPDEARRQAQLALACAARHGGPAAASAAALAHGELAWLALQANDFERVQTEIDAGIVQARIAATQPSEEGGYVGYEIQLRIIEIESQMRQERFVSSAHAVDLALQALDAHTRPFLLDRFHFVSLRCNLHRQLGDLAGAAAQRDQALALAAQIEMPRIRAQALICVAEVALVSGDLAAAEQVADEVEAITDRLGLAYLLPLLWRWRGDAAWKRSELGRADEAWARAAELYRAQDRPPEMLQVQAWRARLQWQRAARGEADSAGALQAVQAVLAEAAASQRPQHRALEPGALLACHEVLTAAGDPRAAELLSSLQGRLREQLDALPDDDQRARLLQHVAHWREVAALGGAPAA